MGHVYWPTVLAIPSDLHAYFIISLSLYDLLKALSSCRKMVHCGASKDFNFFNELYVRCIRGTGWSRWQYMSEIWHLPGTCKTLGLYRIIRRWKRNIVGGILDNSVVVRRGTSGLWFVSGSWLSCGCVWFCSAPKDNPCCGAGSVSGIFRVIHCCHYVESVECTHDNSTQHMLINMVTHDSMRSQHALQAKNIHNKYIYGHNCTILW